MSENAATDAPRASASDSKRRPDDGVSAQGANAQADVADDRLEPGEDLHVAALLAHAQRAAEAPRHLTGCILRRRAAGHELTHTLVDMELQLGVEVALDAAGTEHVDETGPGGRRRLVLS
jgi:hypothetical protein